MATFEYKGYTEAGRLSRGLVEALDRKEAREKLARQGIFTETVSAAGGERRRWIRAGRGSFTLEARAMIYRELGALVKAGLPLAGTLDLLVQSPETGDHRTILASVYDRIREGESLADAMEAASSQVTPFEAAVIGVGERTGSLDTVLDRLATFLEEQQVIRERITTALIYPSMVFILAAGIGFAVLSLMVPRIGELLAETQMELPLLTRVMMAAADGISQLALPALAIAALVAFAVGQRWQRDASLRERMNRILYQVPVVGPTYIALVSLRFTRTLALLVRGGVQVVDALPLAGRATGSRWLWAHLEKETEAVRHGRSIADAVRNVPYLRSSLPGWVEAGEQSGDLAGLLDHAGDRYQRQWDRRVTRSLALLEPILVLLIGGFVLLIALSILLPVLSMNQQIQ